MYQRHRFLEPFDQTNLPSSYPDGLSWNFQSPKSDIKNFNEETYLHQGLNPLEANLSSQIGLNQPLPDWIYPYTYVNRAFDHILLTLANKIEKDHNQNQLLAERNNEEWTAPYPYQSTSWDLLANPIKSVIVDVFREINRRFNMTPPIVDYKKDIIKYYWVDYHQLIVILTVYKAYTACDIEYLEDVDPHINDHLKSKFETKLLIYVDNLDETGQRYHLRYLRFPEVDYSTKNGIDDMRYIKEFDHYFYLSRSKDPYYRMLSNTEARDVYLSKVKEFEEKTKYKCFGAKDRVQDKLQRVDDRTLCELAGGIWEKMCEKNEDCPYYQANRNYPNTFGGCDISTGYCQWPVGVEALTFRKPANPEEALCYNCFKGILGNGTLGNCCQDQEDKRIYVNLETPDYYFIGDREERFKERDLFAHYNLNWSKYT